MHLYDFDLKFSFKQKVSMSDQAGRDGAWYRNGRPGGGGRNEDQQKRPAKSPAGPLVTARAVPSSPNTSPQ